MIGVWDSPPNMIEPCLVGKSELDNDQLDHMPLMCLGLVQNLYMRVTIYLIHSLIYSFTTLPIYHQPEFADCMHRWVERFLYYLEVMQPIDYIDKKLR
jgi:hypothetical protein